MTPYSLGYASSPDVIVNGQTSARIINKAGNIVDANTMSVSLALLEKGGNWGTTDQATLVDGSSWEAWPITGYAYLAVRRKEHLGDCSRRKLAMQMAFDIFYSEVMKASGARLGSAILPATLRDAVVNDLVNSVVCSDGTYALDQYRVHSDTIGIPNVFSITWKLYMDSYAMVDANLAWINDIQDDSRVLWSKFSANPDSYISAFTVSMTPEERQQRLSVPHISSVQFANLAVALIYNIYAFDSRATGPLRLTKDIIAGIFCGAIQYWNDTKIQDANSENKQYLPGKRITVVARISTNDASGALVRYLTSAEPTVYAPIYQRLLASSGGDHRSFPFATLLDPQFVIDAPTHDKLDSTVSVLDGSIGLFIQDQTYIKSRVASYCHDPHCAGPVLSPNDGGAALAACRQDAVVSEVLAGGERTRFSDLYLSTSPLCYPISISVDYSMYSAGDAATCAMPREDLSVCVNPDIKTQSGLVDDRVRFGRWLLNGDAVVGTLNILSVLPSTPSQRSQALNSTCHIQCNGELMGYNFCGYRDCKWSDGDFEQVVSPCNTATATRTVTYVVKPSSPCLTSNPAFPIPSTVTIQCPFVPFTSTIGGVGIAMSGTGAVFALWLMVMFYIHRKKEALKMSQPVFMMTFMAGALLTNLVILTFLGPNTDVSCMLRPWLFNLSTTLMFAPLLMKLHRVDRLFNNPLLRKIKITNARVGAQIFACIVIDLAILLIWSLVQTPRLIKVMQAYGKVLAPVEDSFCSTGMSTTMEGVMVAYKAVLLAAGVNKVREYETGRE